MTGASRHDRRMHPGASRGAALDPLLHEVLDGERTPIDPPVLEAMERDPKQAELLAETRAALADLSTPVAAPDLSARVLEAVHARRPFSNRHVRRRVNGTRLAWAVGTLGIAALIAVTVAWPGRPGNPAPRVASRSASSDPPATVANAPKPEAPVRVIAAAPKPERQTPVPLSLGSTARYDSPFAGEVTARAFSLSGHEEPASGVVRPTRARGVELQAALAGVSPSAAWVARWLDDAGIVDELRARHPREWWHEGWEKIGADKAGTPAR